MKLYDYFKFAVGKELFLHRHWLIRSTAIVDVTNSTEHRTAGDWFIGEDKKAYVTLDDGTVEEITEFVYGEPLIARDKEMMVPKGDYSFIKEDTKTYYSTFITNLMFQYSFPDTVPYYNQRFKGSMVDKIVSTGMLEGKITPAQGRTFSKCMNLMTVLTHSCVPSGTIKGLMPIPGAKELRDKLEKKYGDTLSDPVVLSKMENELLEFAMKHLEGDEIHEFRLKDKNFAVSMKRVHLMFGGEPRQDDSGLYDYSTRSLVEGWDIENLPMYANSSRMGSYNRGALTAIGGEVAEFSSRVFATKSITEDDCGTKVGEPTTLRSYNHDGFEGRYHFKNNKVVPIKEGETKAMIGSTILLRGPNVCLTTNDNYCKICMGDRVTNANLGLGIQASKPGQAILRAYLALMHGTKLETRPYTLEGLG